MNKKTKNLTIFVFVGLAVIFMLIGLICYLSKNRNSNFVDSFSKNKNEYNLVVDINCDEKIVNVKQTTKYINTTENVSLDSVYFHIFPKAFSERVVNKPVSKINETKAYPNGVDYGKVDLSCVKIEENEILPKYINADEDILVVDLNEELLPNKSVEIYFEYTLELPNINHRYGYGENTINLGNFYLIACVYDEGEGFFANSYHYNGDPFYSDMSNFKTQVSFNDSFVLATTGNVLKEENIDGKTIKTIEARAVRDFALTLSDKFQVLSEDIGTTKINYYYYNDKTPEKSLKACVDAVNTFNELFNTYPYKQLSVCESNFVYGGMEYPNLVLISDSLENYEDYIYTIVHEIAHQWWYQVVGNNEYKYGFLDEGLTEYSTYLFFDYNPSYEMDTREMIKNTTNSYLLFVDVYKEVFGKVDTSMLRSLDEYNTEPEYIYMAYVKGVLMYDNLREIVGENKFLKTLKYYYNQNMGKNAKPEDLIFAFNKICGSNFESYFNSWLTGSVVIENL